MRRHRLLAAVLGCACADSGSDAATTSGVAIPGDSSSDGASGPGGPGGNSETEPSSSGGEAKFDVGGADSRAVPSMHATSAATT